MPRSASLRSRPAPFVLLLALALVAGLIAIVSGINRAADAAEPVVVTSNDFEDGTTQGWTPRADETVAHSTAAAHGGTGSLLVSGRTRTWEGPVKDLLGTATKGTRFTYSVWARMAANEAATQLRMSVERRDSAGTPTYENIVANTNVGNGAWTQLTGSYTLSADVAFLTLYVESASGTGAFHIDDFSASYLPAGPIQTTISSLKDVFAADFPIGAAITGSEILGEHARLLTKHFNSVTPGNALKWDATEPTENTFRYTDADPLVNFAVANGMKIRGHTLVWHNQTPAWVFQNASGGTLTNSAADKAILLSRLENHIRTVMGRYQGKIYAWDVVNEVIDENQGDGLRRSNWYTIAGLDYIRTAFRVAREVDPAAKLFINDYNTNVPTKRDKLYNLVSQLKAEGVPIDGVGHQQHGNYTWPTGAETDAMIAKFIPLGVTQEITEMDVSIYTSSSESFPTPPADRLTQQAARYKAWFDVYRKYKANLSNVTFWGLADDNTWLDTFPVNRKDAPLLFDVTLQAKPAYYSIVESVTTGPTTPATTRVTIPPTTRVTTPPTTRVTTPPTTRATTRVTTAPTTSGPVGTCSATYRVVGQWQGGFQGEVVVTAGAAPITGWTVGWTFPNGQAITQIWGGTASPASGTISVRNVSWNGTLAAGQSATFGFLGSWNGTNAVPSPVTCS